MRVITNNHRREMLAFEELTDDERETFDYVDADERWTPRFVRAYGSTHDAHDAQAITVAPDHSPFGYNVTADSPLARFHGIATESHRTGVAFRFLGNQWDRDGLSEDDGFVVVARVESD